MSSLCFIQKSNAAMPLRKPSTWPTHTNQESTHIYTCTYSAYDAGTGSSNSVDFDTLEANIQDRGKLDSVRRPRTRHKQEKYFKQESGLTTVPMSSRFRHLQGDRCAKSRAVCALPTQAPRAPTGNFRRVLDRLSSATRPSLEHTPHTWHHTSCVSPPRAFTISAPWALQTYAITAPPRSRQNKNWILSQASTNPSKIQNQEYDEPHLQLQPAEVTATASPPRKLESPPPPHFWIHTLGVQ